MTEQTTVGRASQLLRHAWGNASIKISSLPCASKQQAETNRMSSRSFRLKLHPLPPPEDRPRPEAAARGYPWQPDRPHRRGRAAGLGRRSGRTQGQPRRRNNKLAQIEITTARRTHAVGLGMPAYPEMAAIDWTAAITALTTGSGQRQFPPAP